MLKEQESRAARVDRAGPQLRRTLGRFVWTTYDHLGRLALVNLCAAAIIFGPVALASANPVFLVLSLGWAFAAWAVLQTGLTAYALEMRRFRDPSIGAFWAFVRRFAWNGLKIYVLYAAAAVVLCVNIVFWIHPRVYYQQLRWPGAIIAGLCVWALAYLPLTALYAIPLAIEKGYGAFGAAKRAMLLTLDNLGATLGAAVVLALVEAALIVSAAGFVLIGLTAVSTLSAALYATVLYKYDRPSEQTLRPPPSTLHPSPSTLDCDGEPIRSLREIWRPWDA